MGARRLTPEMEALEHRREEVLARMRWLSPNATRRRELKAEHVALTRRALELEAKATEPPYPAIEEEDDPRSRVPRMWWTDQ